MIHNKEPQEISRKYSVKRITHVLPRLPLRGNLDLTYRCNFNCRHCWLRIPQDSSEVCKELSLEEIKSLSNDARNLGCGEWSISGGEPLLRPDFLEIFDYLTKNATRYSLNTNGSLVTPKIARALCRPGTKMIALYGATPEVFDRVTRVPGSFEMSMRGFAYLQEAGAGFIVQLIPMQDNFHEWEKMLTLAQSLSPRWRVGASWLHLSANGSSAHNATIRAQRLSPDIVVHLDKPNPKSKYENHVGCGNAVIASAGISRRTVTNDSLFAECIAVRRDFHIDPYGHMSFCSYIKDPELRYDLRHGTFEHAWKDFIPSLAERETGGDEYKKNCGTCSQRENCRWCPVFSYLETGRYSAPISYLCKIADQTSQYKKDWREKHCRYFQIAGMTICLESEIDFDAFDFKEELLKFQVAGAGKDNVTLRHYFNLPDITGKDLGKELYRKAPWAIFHDGTIWYYLGISPDPDDLQLHRIALFNDDYTQATIYSPEKDQEYVSRVGFQSLSLFPTDQIWLAPLLANRHAAIFHSAAVNINGKGLLFVGHSESGKSTTIKILQQYAEANAMPIEILCDDRNIVRRWDTGWHVHGTWSHGEVSDVSPRSAPLCALLFLQQTHTNALLPLTERKESWKRLLATLIKPMVTADWWNKELDVLQKLVHEVPLFTMHFDKTGEIAPMLVALTLSHSGE